MSNNFDGPIILDSTFDNVTEPGYLGTGGRAGEASVGPRLSGGTAAVEWHHVVPESVKDSLGIDSKLQS